MGIFLNPTTPLTAYQAAASARFFVDKTWLIDGILKALAEDGQKYVCITRPRRFGKTVMANMIAAFLGKAATGDLFEHMAIARSEHFQKHLNQHHVIYIDFSRMPRDCTDYSHYINRIQDGINRDLATAYPEFGIDEGGAVWDALAAVFDKTKHKFIFVMDEWDAIFHKPLITEQEQRKFLEFLKDLLKDQGYVELAYMTGILPIAKYSDGSELNMFDEYDMATKEKYSEYFGFLDKEVDALFETYQKTTSVPKISRADLTSWYDGYHTASGNCLYNPRSIVCALRDNQLANYWTGSGSYDTIFHYIKGNIKAVRDDLALMVSGAHVKCKMRAYAATARRLDTSEQIYSAMVVYGLLTYTDGKVFIPNRELMDKFNELLLSNDNLGYVYDIARESTRMLKATLAGDTKTMAEILKYTHDTESPIFSYNSEIELSAVVNLVYLAARDQYRVEREDEAGEGYVDFIFYPEHKGADGIILELKVDGSPEEAISQIRDKNYALRFMGKLGEKPKYTGRTLAVGINYSKKTKKHSCKVEVL